MYTTFFWDLDGTLYDTYPQMVRAFAETLEQLQIPADRAHIYRLMRQDSLGVAFDWYAARFAVTRVQLEARYYPLEKQLQQPQLFAGVREVLTAVVAAGGRNFLLTHRNDRSLTFMHHDGIMGLFTDYVTADQPFPRKPDPTSLNYLIDRNRVQRSGAVMIGDRNLDVEAGHRAQIDGILFDPDQLIQATSHPESRIEKMTTLLEMIKSGE